MQAFCFIPWRRKKTWSGVPLKSCQRQLIVTSKACDHYYPVVCYLVYGARFFEAGKSKPLQNLHNFHFLQMTVWDLGMLQQAFVCLCIPRWLDQFWLLMRCSSFFFLLIFSLNFKLLQTWCLISFINIVRSQLLHFNSNIIVLFLSHNLK